MVQKSRLLRKGFEIETNKSWTIIPQYPPTSEVSLDAVSTLRKLETLSEVSAFELYTATISEFNRLYSRLEVSWRKERKKKKEKNHGISGRKIEYSRLYPEGRGATICCSELQGLHDASDDTQEDNNHAKPRSLNRRRDHAAPPSYERGLPASRIELGP